MNKNNFKQTLPIQNKFDNQNSFCLYFFVLLYHQIDIALYRHKHSLPQRKFNNQNNFCLYFFVLSPNWHCTGIVLFFFMLWINLYLILRKILFQRKLESVNLNILLEILLEELNMSVTHFFPNLFYFCCYVYQCNVLQVSKKSI